ncbi:pyridoxal phosphate-dependent transferase [Coniella lustricola]|uniref:histidinol-phosphate transaminase n=1 Tax=Coniella lustricola TaxID=2025994 RepID=A0A2T3A3T1_9PEZI|nr:pyridoxal phosphate-dependent transferase [Coniella lustricola]
MSPFNLETCARPNILRLQPYRCARDDYKDDGHNVLLDANENAYGPPLSATTAAAVQASLADLSSASAASSDPDPSSPAAAPPPPPSGASLDLLGLHRYPDPHQHDLKQLLCNLRNRPDSASPPLTPANLLVGVGSDETIDALLRAFCVPGRDAILVCPPTYGMYSVSADVNDVALVRVPLLPAPTFQLDVPAILAKLDESVAASAAVAAGGSGQPSTSSSTSAGQIIKLLYLCSPGNPTGSLLSASDIATILAHPTWNGLVVVDEAYIDFATGPDGSSYETASLAPLVTSPAHPNLVVMQTLSKGFGFAGIRLGAAFASPAVAELLNRLKAPYNISSPTSALAQYALSPGALARMHANRARIVAQRERLVRELAGVAGVGRLRGGLASNFLLYEMVNRQGKPDNEVALRVYERLAEEKGVVVRFRGREVGCEGCLRITIGTEEEVGRFLEALRRVLAEVRGGGAAAGGAEEKEEEDKREKEANGVVA